MTLDELAIIARGLPGARERDRRAKAEGMRGTRQRGGIEASNK
jgi:hypothetical protein